MNRQGRAARRGAYGIPANRFKDAEYDRVISEIEAGVVVRRRQIDEANGVRHMTPAESEARERWEETKSSHGMSWEQYQREIVNSDLHKPKRVASGGVRTKAQAERLAETLRSRGAVFELEHRPVSLVNIPKDKSGAIALEGPIPLIRNEQTGNVNLFWKSGQVFLFIQSFDIVGAETWSWHQCDPKRVSEMLKLGP